MTKTGIRPRTSARVFLLQSLIAIYSFTAAAFRNNPPSVSDDPLGLVRLAIPAAAAILGLLLRDAMANAQQRPPHAAALDVVAAYGLAFLSQWVLSVVEPDLMLPRWAPTQGGLVGMALLTAARALFPPDWTSTARPAERRHAFLRAAYFCYAATPVTLFLLLGSRVYLYGLPLVMLLLAELLRREADKPRLP